MNANEYAWHVARAHELKHLLIEKVEEQLGVSGLHLVNGRILDRDLFLTLARYHGLDLKEIIPILMRYEREEDIVFNHFVPEGPEDTCNPNFAPRVRRVY